MHLRGEGVFMAVGLLPALSKLHIFAEVNTPSLPKHAKLHSFAEVNIYRGFPFLY